MEADWEIEIGGDAPVIDAHWSGFVDLRENPELVMEMSECAEFPALGRALAILNNAQSPVWTSKCDVWVVEDFAEYDRDEFDAAADEGHAIACYIDILPREKDAWKGPENAIRFCSEMVEQLKALVRKAARAELILRQAVIGEGEQATGITVYVTGCGASLEAARSRLSDALEAVAKVLSVPA